MPTASDEGWNTTISQFSSFLARLSHFASSVRDLYRSNSVFKLLELSPVYFIHMVSSTVYDEHHALYLSLL